MQNNRTPSILVFGAEGMLGHTVYNYIKSQYPKSTYGTNRKNLTGQNFLCFDVFNHKGFKLFNKIPKIQYIINCIGILPGNPDIMQLHEVNSKFPNKLAEFAEKQKINVIHISTDDVFDINAGSVDEDNIPNPSTTYGKSKLQGESNLENVINIRTSILGLDPNRHKGLLEWAKTTTDIQGYTNQIWSGCTTLQFAKFVFKIIDKNEFKNMRKVSGIFHFTPLRNVTKYAIIDSFLGILQSGKTVTETKSQTSINRVLTTKYSELLFMNDFSTDLKLSLNELILFEKNK